MVPLYRCKNRFRGSGASRRRRRKELPGKTGLELESQILSRPGWSLHRAAWIQPRGGAGGTHFAVRRAGEAALPCSHLQAGPGVWLVKPQTMDLSVRVRAAGRASFMMAEH